MCVWSSTLTVPPQFPHFRWRGLPRVVQQQLYRIGVGAGGGCPGQCVLCASSEHGCFACPQRGSPNGRAMWDAWDRRWLLLQARELKLYALCSSDAEHMRRSGAVFVPSPVAFNMVRQLRGRKSQYLPPHRQAHRINSGLQRRRRCGRSPRLGALGKVLHTLMQTRMRTCK